MKSRLFIFFYFILFAHNLYGQEIKFRHFSEPYIYLNDEYPITQKIRWRDDQSLSARLDYSINFGGIQSNYLDIHSNGYCNYYDERLNRSLSIFGFFYYDLIDRSYKTGSSKPQSMISYQLDTIGFEKLVKLQFKNAGFESGGINDSVNFQIWAFEYSNKVQVRFGKSYIQNWLPILGIDSPSVGAFLDLDSVNFIGGCLNGSTSNPSFNFDNGRFTNVPAEGTVYEFYLEPIGINSAKIFNEFQYFILDKHIEINLGSNTKLIATRLFDLLGREIETSKNSTLEIHSVPSGIYLLRVETEMGYLTKRIKID